MIKSATENGFQYFVNTNSTIVYAFDIANKKIKKIFKSDWAATPMEIIKEDKKGNAQKTIMNIEDIINEKNDIFKVVIPIASTMKQAGYFRQYDPSIGLHQEFLNEYLNSEIFISAREQQHPNGNSIEMLKTNCPNINLLLRNLFHNENDEVFQNFLNWVANIAYKDERQDVFWLFKGTDEDNQGQGAGKGIFRDLMSDLFSGLVATVNNESYKNNFNSRLMNMKLVIFDELNFKALKYEVIKDLTGASMIEIEFKNKEAITTVNVSSWLFFTNEYDMLKKIIENDRRCFLIHPNPANDSLSKIVSDFGKFKEEIYRELPEFINVLAHCDLNVKKPNQLRTAAHYDYFTNQHSSQIRTIPSISKFFTNKHDRDCYIDFLKQLEKIDSNADYSEQQFFIENEFIYYKQFEKIYKVCQEHKIAAVNNQTPQKVWKELREDLKKARYKDYRLDKELGKNGSEGRITENCLRSPLTDKKKQSKITKYIVKNYNHGTKTLPQAS